MLKQAGCIVVVVVCDGGCHVSVVCVFGKLLLEMAHLDRFLFLFIHMQRLLCLQLFGLLIAFPMILIK